ncbi:glutathione S-transferase family protein [Deinococcus peraridilitoris]|uniref:Putative glutathione S-transferase n=1 Tax=Deinococcus peraridilitoris (strain DSM 19664 / LMG 22246 / CIP 109416 / KR-200) TaxID=937777 RepID=L0A2B5_DEIPD|nr:glutathione S-transferase family protein [Deinococcus peraridilitoris]AFZ67327.1 putative glutathione S-transferase [Deinococcus peraridilitoris DSM 19664]
MTSQFPAETSKDGAFVRQRYQFRGRLSADGSSGFPSQAGRYHLYVSLACPWAHRAIIVRELLGLQQAVPMTVVDPVRDERGWAFREGPGHGRDPVCDFQFLSEAYLRTDPGYTGRYTVPCLWDTVTGRLVSNNYPDLTIDFETQFTAFQRTDAPDLYPEVLRPEIDAINERIYEDVNNGVYKAGFATTQEKYDEAVMALFARLDALEAHLSTQRYLVGGQLSEADIRLFTTLVRFDAVYHLHFKCNLRRLTDYPHLWGYARDLYQRPGFASTVDFDHIKRHYYLTHERLNPSRIVPRGPLLDWNAPHGRGQLG